LFKLSNNVGYICLKMISKFEHSVHNGFLYVEVRETRFSPCPPTGFIFIFSMLIRTPSLTFYHWKKSIAISLTSGHRLTGLLYSNAVSTICQQDMFALLIPSLLTSCQRLISNLLQGCWAQLTGLLQIVPTTCHRPAIQLFVNKLWATTLYSNLIK
jgi:hypothetical protein